MKMPVLLRKLKHARERGKRKKKGFEYIANLQEVKAAVTGLLRASMENLEAKWLEMNCRMLQMEEKLASIQTQISEHSETPSSSDSRTPVSLQVCKPIFPLLSILPL